MTAHTLLILLICTINNSVRVFLEVTIVNFSTFNLSSDIATHLHRTDASISQVIGHLPNSLILSLVFLCVIDWKFNYRHWLCQDLRIAYQKAVLPSELPHVILKMMFLAFLNIRFFSASVMIAGLGISLFFLMDRVKPISQIFFLIFEVHNSLTLFAKSFKDGFGIVICALFTAPILWVGAEWFTHRKLPIEQLVIFPIFNIFILLSLFRLIKIDRTGV
jgi:hypothetical protein